MLTWRATRVFISAELSDIEEAKLIRFKPQNA